MSEGFSSALRDELLPLAHGDEDQRLVAELCRRVTGRTIVDDRTVYDLGAERQLVCRSSAALDAQKWPASFCEALQGKEYSLLVRYAGDPSGYVDTAYILGDHQMFDPQSAMGTEPASWVDDVNLLCSPLFGDHGWLYNPTRTGPGGEPTIAYFADGGIEKEVDLTAGSLFLRLVASALGISVEIRDIHQAPASPAATLPKQDSVGNPRVELALVARLGQPSSGWENRLTCLAWTRDQQMLWAGFASGLVVFDARGHEHRLSEKEVRALAMSPDGQSALVGGSGVSLWDVGARQVRHTLVPHGTFVRCVVAFSADGGRAYVSRGGSTVRCWDLATMKPLTDGDSWAGSGDCRLSPDGELIVVRQRHLVTYHTKTGHKMRDLGGGETEETFEFSPSGKWLLSSEGDDVCGWNLHEGGELCWPDLEPDTFAIAPSDRFVATNEDCVLLIRTLPGGREIAHLNDHTLAIDAPMAFANDEKLAVQLSDGRLAIVQLRVQ